MADDILLTQEEQDERAKQWLKDNGMALAVGIVLGLGAVFGFNQYKANLLAKSELASQLYDQLTTQYTQSELADISQTVATLKNEHADSSYAAKAVLLRAKQLSLSDLPKAAEELQWVADNASEAGLRHAARIRLAKAKVAMGELSEASQIASQLPYEGFDSYYYEILADIAALEDDPQVAREYYQQAIDSLDAGSAGYSAILKLKMTKLPAAATPVTPPVATPPSE